MVGNGDRQINKNKNAAEYSKLAPYGKRFIF